MESEKLSALEQTVRETAIGQTRDAVQKIRNLFGELQRNLESAADEMEETSRQSVSMAISGAVEELAEQIRQEAREADQAAGRSVAALAMAIIGIHGRESQVEVLEAMLRGARQVVQRVALFVLKDETAAGWRAYGFSAARSGIKDTAIRKVHFELGSENSLARSLRDRETLCVGHPFTESDEELLESLGPDFPSGFLAVPMVIRDRVLAVLYGDSLEADAPDQEALATFRALVASAAAAIERMPGRTKKSARPKPEPVSPAAPQPSSADDSEQQPSESDGPAQPSSAEEVDEEEDSHEDAKRFARLLVSEIKLYNEAKVAVGRKNKDLYQRLRTDIERSRQMYNERVPPSVASKTNYFMDELVRVLAEGDPGSLGM